MCLVHVSSVSPSSEQAEGLWGKLVNKFMPIEIKVKFCHFFP